MADKATAGDAKKKDPPLYQQIADDLREEIMSGTYAHGDRLQSESEIMAQRNVSRPTAHRALEELEAEGLVELRQGVPPIVRAWVPIVRNVGKRFGRGVWGAGRSVWEGETEGREYGLDSLRVYRGEPPARVVQYLGAHDAWIRERRHFVDGRPVMLSVSYYPADIVDGSPITQPETGDGGAPAVLAELGHAPHNSSERLRARMPMPEERERLQLPPGNPVAATLRTVQDEAGRVVEVTEMVASGDAYIFQFDFTS